MTNAVLAPIFRRAEEQLSTELDGETVLLSIKNGQYYKLDAVATRIWQLLEEPQSLESLVDQLLAEYEVERDQCTTDVQGYLDELESEGLLAIEA
jgi:hypothetical protein